MAYRQETKVTRTTNTDDDGGEDEGTASGSVLVARLINYLFGIILIILSFRFVLALLGANRSNEFAQFVFNLSHPLVQPFFGLFGYEPVYGRSHLELFTLVAMAVYAVIAWGIIALIRLPHRDPDV